MKKTLNILHINSVNFGSTGNIMLDISRKANKYDYNSLVAYANSRSNKNKNVKNSILISNVIERNIHLKLGYFSGYNGCFSKVGTKAFLRKVDRFKPDIIHLHNLHNCYINLKLLFDYIKEQNISVVWTLHDCWAFTGQCSHFTEAQCEKWLTGCYECPQIEKYPASRVDKTKEMYLYKREWFTGVKKMTIVTPSNWLAKKVKVSFLKEYPVKVINNGIDLSVFKPRNSNFREKYSLEHKKIILGVAHSWSKSKGLDIFTGLASRLREDYQVVLVGLTAEQMKELPSNILGLQATNNREELAEIYTAVDYFVNPSIEETMGLVTVEAIACGTPTIVSNLTAVPEMVNEDSGVVVKEYDVDSFYEAIITNNEFSEEKLLKWANKFEVNEKYNEYLNLYDSIPL